MKDLKIVISEGKNYLGCVEVADNGAVTIKNCLMFKIESHIVDTTLSDYLLQENVGELKDVKLQGNVSYSIQELSNKQTEKLEYYNIVMTRAKKKASGYAENGVFKELIKNG